MVEDDTFTYHVKQQSRDQTNTAAHSLITKERTQKLDLLIHLLSNLTQALVVCGPEGIGKTTLLKVLQERKTESWRYCLIQGNADLSFEVIQQQLAENIRQGNSGRHEGQYKQVVLIIDNAGELVPGLIAAIIQYAAANSVLRVIFALTHDELQVKRGSDRAVDDCHIVEIPPLSEKQCGDFLQHLSANPATNLTFKAIGENMIAHIYRDTHGVPGKIIAKISGLSGAKQGGKLKWILVLAVAAAMALAFGVQWLVSSKNKDKGVIAPTAVEQKANNVEMAPQQPESQIMLTLPPAQPVIQPQEQSVPTNEVKPSTEVNAGSDDQQLVIPAVKPETSSTIVIKPLPEQLEVKAQSEPVSAAGVTQEQNNKQAAVVAQQKITEPLVSKQEKQKQAELSNAANSVEPFTPNDLETIQIPLKPVEVAGVFEQRAIETTTPQQVELDGSSAQSGNNFTLQLMVLSKQSSVEDILKKYPAMGPDFRAIKTMARGKEKFILEYGSYPDAASANKARESLPFEFRKALVRKIVR